MLKKLLSAVFREFPARPAASTTSPFRLQGPDAPAARRVTIGLDFGTSGTKAIVQFEDRPSDGDRFLIVPLETGARGVGLICPSTIAVHDGIVVIGQEAEGLSGAIRSFKMCIPCVDAAHRPQQCPRCLQEMRGFFRLGDHRLDALDVCTLYLAQVIARIKEGLKAYVGQQPLSLRLNSAAPLDQMHSGADLRGPFELVLYRAWKLSDEVPATWRLEEAMRALEALKSHAVPAAAESPTFLIPETHAAMTAYILTPGRARGRYAAVDIGAGTTDVSFFWCGHENGVPKAWYYSAKSDFVGVDDLDRIVIDHEGGQLGDMRKRRADEESELTRWPDDVRVVLGRIYTQYRLTFGQAFGRDMGDNAWVRVVQAHEVTDIETTRAAWGHPGNTEYTGHIITTRLATFTLCLVGGGAQLQCIRSELEKPLASLRLDKVDVEIPGLPEQLLVMHERGESINPPETCINQLPLLLLAYGLAHRAMDIPEWAEHHPVDRPIQYRPEVTHEDLYG